MLFFEDYLDLERKHHPGLPLAQETQEAEHFDWLSGWHQRLLSAISSEKLGSHLAGFGRNL